MRKHQAPWIVHLLPYLECGNLYDQLQSASADDVPALAEREIEYLICPEHEQPDRGGISYVANAGMIAVSDWSRLNSIRHRAEWYDFPFHENGNDRVDDADRDVAISTGVFWREALESTSPSHRLVTLESISVHDGTSQTVLLAENLQARSYDRTTAEGGWVSDATGDIAFGIAVAGQEVSSRFQVAENTQPTGVGSSAGDVAHALVLSEQPVSQNCLINANRRSAIPGCSPRPSSNHLGTVNMAFADGSCKVISDQIAPDVYARLLSPSGNSYGQSPLQSSDF